MDSVGDLLEVERKRFSSLIRVVEPVLEHEGEPTANERAGARLARTGHQTRHTLVWLDVGCKSVKREYNICKSGVRSMSL